MIAIKLENISRPSKSGRRIRHNQNFTMTLWNNDYDIPLTKDTTPEEIKGIMMRYYSKRILLNQHSIIKIIHNSYK